MEAYYVAQGYLFPSFHTFYWLGLNASSWPVDSGTPNFTWLDKTPGPSNESYLHWGLWVDGWCCCCCCGCTC